jgi:hypothetical protein
VPEIQGNHYPYGTIPPLLYPFLNARQLETERIIRLQNEQERGELEEMPSKKTVKVVQHPVEGFLNAPVSHVIRRNGAFVARPGHLFGLELELEGKGLTTQLAIPGWAGHEDGSLRGESSVEWVSSKPVSYDTTLKKIDQLFKGLEKSGAKIKNSYRTSTHVHLNYSDKYVYQVITTFVVYTILEDIIAHWCGTERSGNLFCLGARDAENTVNVMNDSVFRHNNFAHFNNELRYAGLNLCSLNKFGTIEFRTMRGVDNPKEAKEWVEIVNEFYSFCINNTKSPAEILEMVSHEGARGFVEKIFSKDVADQLVGKMSENEIYSSLYEGLRLIQMFCYNISSHWKITSEYKVKPEKEVGEINADIEMMDEMNAPAPQQRFRVDDARMIIIDDFANQIRPRR